MENSTSKQKRSTSTASIKHYILFFLFLYVLWFVLSGHTTIKIFVLGFLISLAILWLTWPLLKVPAVDGKGFFFGFDLPYGRYVLYWPWLFWQVCIASFLVAVVIINPRMPIDPVMVQFRKKMPHPAAVVTLGNSITMTPGTLTVDVDDEGLYTVHALWKEPADDLAPQEGEGKLVTKVDSIFKGKVPLEE